MRLWWEVAKRSFVRYSTYRAATFAGVFTNTVFGFIRASILVAVYRQRDVIGGFDLTDSVTFAFATQGMLAAIGAFGGHLPLADRIQTGDVVTDLYRPADVQGFELATDAGRAAFQFLSRGFVPLLVGSFFFELRLPASPAIWAAFLFSFVLALGVSFGIRFLVTMSTFWFLDYRAPSQMAALVMMFFSGFILPVGFFPDWLETLARVLPFVATVQIPFEIFLGKHDAGATVALLGVQALWAIVLLAGGRAVLARATRRVVVQGG